MKKGVIILRPLLTEKMSRLEDRQNKYAFAVDRRANKLEIKKAVEARFEVKVAKVATMNVKGKSRTMTVRSGGRIRRTTGTQPDWKKAVLTLREGDKIELFEKA